MVRSEGLVADTTTLQQSRTHSWACQKEIRHRIVLYSCGESCSNNVEYRAGICHNVEFGALNFRNDVIVLVVMIVRHLHVCADPII